jgi:hypothetical protein
LEPRGARRSVSISAWLCALALAALAWLVPSSASATSLPPAGTDAFSVVGQVGVTSRLGSETFAITGTATIGSATPHMEGPVEVADMGMAALDLSGASLVGEITISKSSSLTSLGELRGLQPPPDSFPASSFFDVYIEAVAPANPNPTITLYNTVPLHMVPASGGNEVQVPSWPPYPAVTYVADTTPCVPLLPTLPLNACITSLSATLSPVVGGVSELAARAPDRAARDNARSITALEGVLIGVAAVCGVVVLTGAGWYLRRRRPER